MHGSKLTHIGNGAVRSDASLSLAERLLQLDEGLAAVVAKYAPDYAAVEQTFVNRDGAATLKLGQARAVCLLVPARRKISVSEYAPNFIKRSVTGSGHADKNQIKTMVSMRLMRWLSPLRWRMPEILEAKCRRRLRKPIKRGRPYDWPLARTG
jgi:crossover junction endodeoxyribonuclease RuvC